MQYISFTRSEILNTLSRLSIKTANINSDIVDVLCPFHDDKNLGNGKYYINRGYFKCYSGRCGKVSNIAGIVMHVRHLKYKEAFEFIKGYAYSNNKQLNYGYRKELKSIREENKRSPRNRSVFISYLKFKPLNSEEFYYTRSRGFDKEFVEKHNIQICCSENTKYFNYIIIPITDKTLNLSLFEARKFMLHEVYEDILQMKSDSILKLEKEFRKRKWEKSLWKDWRFKYILRPKTYYLRGFQINNTVFNIDNLDFTKPVYVTEGITGLPKVRRVFGENYAATFGADLRPSQIEILKRFPAIYFIPDGDKASVTMIEKASELIENVYVIPKTKEDTDIGYEEELRKTKPIEGTRYCIRKLKLL